MSTCVYSVYTLSSLGYELLPIKVSKGFQNTYHSERNIRSS